MKTYITKKPCIEFVNECKKNDAIPGGGLIEYRSSKGRALTSRSIVLTSEFYPKTL
jgi:hypothetical protein